VVPLGDNAPAADKGLREPPTALPASFVPWSGLV